MVRNINSENTRYSVISQLFVFNIILSINVAEACVILVGLVVVGIKPAEK